MIETVTTCRCDLCDEEAKDGFANIGWTRGGDVGGTAVPRGPIGIAWDRDAHATQLCRRCIREILSLFGPR